MKKKILLSLPSYSSYYLPLKYAFELLGYKVYSFDYRHGDLVSRFIRVFFGDIMASKYVEYKLLSLVNNNNIDLFLTVKGETISKTLLKKMNEKNVTTVNWFPDPMSQWDLMKKVAPWYDFFLHFDPLIIRKLRRLNYKNIFYLPFASEICQLNKEKKVFDVSFIGTYSEFREKYLSNLSRFDLNIWGDNRWYSSTLRRFVRGGRMSQLEMKKVIKRTRININFHFNAGKEGTNLRTFEVTGCRSFLLTEYVKDLRRLFRINKEIACFKNSREMVDKVIYFFDNPKVLDKIAGRGYLRVKKDHNYKKRIKQMLKIVNR